MILSEKKWLLEENIFEISPVKETIFTLSNGYLGVRGTYEDLFYNETPGTYVAGIFDKSEASVKELVNFPYFWGLRLYIKYEYLNPFECNILEFKRILDMKQGILYKKMRLKDKKGRIMKIEGYRFLSMDKKNLALMTYTITSENFSDRITIETFIDGRTYNSTKHPKDRVKHYYLNNHILSEDYIYVEAWTKDEKNKIGILSTIETKSTFTKTSRNFIDFISQSIDIDLKVGESHTINIYTSILDSKRHNDLFNKNIKEINKAKKIGFENLLKNHYEKFKELWKIADIKIVGDEKADKSLRYNIFSLLSLANPEDELVSIGAKGLHGEGYKGHVFWDTEIYMLPFYIYEYPKAAKSFLMYRYHTLDKARENALKNGYRGAQYPWESADNGQEETPKWGEDYYGNKVRIWTGDIEYHITADIAYAIREYLRATDDWEFFVNYGAEIFFETARFWASRAEYNNEKDRYEINNVIGPDEFHEHVNNNFYTNYLAKWNIEKAFEYLNILKQKFPENYLKIIKKINLTNSELRIWKDVAEKLYIPWNKSSHLIEQFENYFKLEDFTISKYNEKNMPEWPEGIDLSNLNKYQLIKQADVLMLMHLLPEDFDFETKKVNFEYYEKRTMHKSSLSPSMYAIMGLAIGNHSKAYEYFMRTALVDLENNQGNTAFGLHAASAGGTWQSIIYGFGGMYIDNKEQITFNPWIPEHWKSLEFNIIYKNKLLNIKITQNSFDIKELPSLTATLNNLT
ncbi:kojibiose phosphorylase [Marinitoga sp. 1197]|uniref:glycoside hydrolase family 65 protein n=1 Tax=unclassified Marinitoga TaxID=2640159 RepID=UPI000640E5DD|nr:MULTISPECIES: glycosyl hydrolase family 65 protein [unclassified Marinitoga]KLO22020.1 kojibiose phosphorylase [Marinitoga sp. 1197]KLO24625.1 kojibiose phosphorylase [Marinitoga sp. 1155]NUU98844.1 kojibiose phosphorylase [Marinitoga sp. 1154]